MKVKLLLIIGLNLILLSFVFRIIYPLHFSPQPLFISDLIGKFLFLPLWLIFLSGIGNIFLLFLISQKLFLKKYSLILPLVYNLSFWPLYLIAGGSNYPFFLFFLLMIFFGYLTSKKVLIILGTLVVSYCSLLMFITVAVLLVGFRLLFPDDSKKLPVTGFVLFLPLLLLIFINLSASKNILHRDIKFFLIQD